MCRKSSAAALIVLIALALGAAIAPTVALAQEDKLGGQVGEMSLSADDAELFEQKEFSPYAGRKFPTHPLWGDTHLHTELSLDARTFGLTLGVEEAYRFALGEELTTSHGLKVRLSRPLDWLAITDHSDGMGAMGEILDGNPTLMRDPQLREWNQRLSQGGEEAFKATMEIIEAFNRFGEIEMPTAVQEPRFVQTVWERYLETAEEYNEPGKFTTIIGYEWTSTEGGNNLHRNVLYRDGMPRARQMLPFTTETSFNPEDLWAWLQAYEDKTGGRVLALAHNGNLSNGIMFPVETNPATGRPLTGDYAQTRARWEPLYEVTQMKGDGEAHPFLSPEDEFSDYESWDKSNLGPVPKESDMLQYEYAREALKNGLQLEVSLGTNPYKFGMVGSTDSHTSLATAQEDNFFGKHSGVEPEADRWSNLIGEFDTIRVMGWEMASSGLAAVWATENTRQAIFDAMMRREIYGTTGSRIMLRFFGGWDFAESDATTRTPARIGYAKGVPMGGDLTNPPEGKAPSFLVAALKDPLSGNLDRIQIIKGWLDANGKTHERVFDVAWSGDRKPGADGKLPPVGNTVDLKAATFTNSIGAPELITFWSDPDFDPDQRAFYYARVIEIPTPRWTAYDAVRFGVEMPKDVPMTTQERAYSSPIWYTP